MPTRAGEQRFKMTPTKIFAAGVFRRDTRASRSCASPFALEKVRLIVPRARTIVIRDERVLTCS